MKRIFGAYLLVHFAMLVPFGAELFSSRGVLPDGAASPLMRLFPNVFSICDAPPFVAALLALAAFASIAMIIGFHDRAAAVIIWYILACLFCRNPLIGNPSLPFVGWMLLVHAVLPPRERLEPAWIVTAIAYSYSGWTKLASPSWIDGTAIAHILTNPLARPTILRTALLACPEPLLHAMTWGTLALELLYAPLALSRRARPAIWTLMLLMHAGLLVLIDFADLSVAMIIVQLFTFDREWLRFDTLRPRNDGTSRLSSRHQLLRFQAEPRAHSGARRRARAAAGDGAAGGWPEVPGAAQGAGESAAARAHRRAARS